MKAPFPLTLTLPMNRLRFSLSHRMGEGWGEGALRFMVPMLCACFVAALRPCQGGEAPGATSAHFIGLDRFSDFEKAERPGVVVMTSPWLRPPRPWNELVVSWNALCPAGGHLTIEARAGRGDTTTPFYNLGRWATNSDQPSRGSVRGQKDAMAAVKTDTLVCRDCMERVQIRLALEGDTEAGRLKFLGLCTLDTTTAPAALAPNPAAWGKVIDVPRRSQLGHPGAAGWCSPTSLSMVLAYWAKAMGRTELDLPVPTVARNVFDPGWEGTGNWVFNTAFAGQFEGMRAYVARLDDLREIEDWVAAGIPVIASVSCDLLNGSPTDQGNGHLIVVVGFTKTGEVVVNDPWPNAKKENSIRKTFSRENFTRAWASSHRTVYLVHPLSVKPPANSFGHWE